jgi:Tol biopolymer transport system component
MGVRRSRPVAVLAFVGLLTTNGCAWITRASVDMFGGDSNAPGLVPSLSADGRYVAFNSQASDLVPGDGNGSGDVFVRDLRTGTTVRASVDIDGGDSNGNSGAPSISADGRYVAFDSEASDLVPGDGNSFKDVFVRDLRAGTTVRASVDLDGGDPNFDSSGGPPSISADGRYVAFASIASDLVPGDGTFGFSTDDIFVRDLTAGTTVRASIDVDGGDPNSFSMNVPSISADGRYVAFASTSSDLVPGDSNNWDVFVRDLQTGTTTLASADINGGTSNGTNTFLPSISADGRYVAFQSDATDLVPGDGNGVYDVFVRDLQAGTTVRASVDVGGGDPDGGSFYPSLNDNGRYVAFHSEASDLISGDGNFDLDVFVRDLHARTTTRSSVDFLGREQLRQASLFASISGNGQYVGFQSAASDLVPGDGNGIHDVFVRAVVTPTVDSLTPSTVARGSTATLTLTGSGFFPGAQASLQAFGPYGLRVNSVDVVSESELKISVTASAAAPTGARNVMVWNPGTGPGPFATGFGFCFGCLTVT